MASGPTSAGITLVIGVGVATVVAIYSMIGYVAKQYLTQQRSNHADTLQALDIARDVQKRLKHMDKHVKKLRRVQAAYAMEPTRGNPDNP